MFDLRELFKNWGRPASGVVRDGYTFAPDEGFDSEAEMQATVDLAKYNATTGPGATDAMVRVIKDDAGAPYVYAWINPHHYDPVAVRIGNDGAGEWAFTDFPSTDLAWRTDLEMNANAAKMVEVLTPHVENLLAKTEAEPIPYLFHPATIGPWL